MTTKAAFSLRNRNPDVLNSIANLSNDEVFTPPDFANQMLDTLEKSWADANSGAIIWQDSSLTFLDPFTKSGVFLREIVSRLSKGLESEIPELQKRVDHILTKQVFGIATTNLTALIARRSVYCSKDANGRHSITKQFANADGHIWFEAANHEWAGGSRKVVTADQAGNSFEKTLGGRCRHCGASQDAYDRAPGLEAHAYGLIHNSDPFAWIKGIFGEQMHFDVIIGNPPYQLNDGGGTGTSATAIYQKFVEQAKLLSPKYLSMVIPARWYSGGKGLDEFREAMLTDDRIRVLSDYFDSSQVFPGVDISGGICFFLWDRDNPGNCEVTSRISSVSSTASRPLLEDGTNTFVRFNEAVTILKKVLTSTNQSFAANVSARKPFGDISNSDLSEDEGDLTIRVFSYPKNGFIDLLRVSKNTGLINKHKVLIAKAYGERGTLPYLVTGKPFIAGPASVCTETYLVARVCSSESEANNVLSYMTTKFFRFLVLLKKNTQNAASGVYGFTPEVDFSRPWSDEALYRHFNLNADEVKFIEELVRPMELPNA